MKVKILLATLLATVLLVGCKSDDDAPAKPAPRVQVMTVFAPGQLGDMGYADRVMKGVSTLKKNDNEDVEVNIIASDNVADTRQRLRDWTGAKSSDIDGANYSRRLLVLTEPYMVDWLVEVKSLLTATDELLLLKVNKDDVQAAAQKLGMDGRVYGLNISVASSVKRFDDMRKGYLTKNGLPADSLPTYLMRLYDDQVMNYRDSIAETLSTLTTEPLDSITLPIIDKAGEQYSTEYKVTAFEAAYHVSGICYAMAYWWIDQHPDDKAAKLFVVSDMGSANSGAEMFLVSTNENILVVMLMIDAESNTDMVRFSVIRHFDRAIADWMQLWLKQPAASMPQMEIHGGWDGYCTDDIDQKVLDV
jgi:hypothetical protein